jgi:sporulation protein YlmC with PRC-barrel domain
MKTERRLAPVPPTAGRTLDAQLHLMDRQVLDNDGVPVTTVDDLELSGPDLDADLPPGTPPPVLTALLTGPVLGTRIFGGRPPSSRLIRIPWTDVADVGVVLRLGVRGDNLDASWVERWIRDKIIARIPGGRHDPR